MNKPAAVDVLITVYNGERFLAQALESVHAQTFTDWKLIVVDDRSTDGTAAILASYATHDPRITIIPGTHEGIAAAANAGLAHVTAPLLARLDADDIAVPTRLQVQYEFMQSHPDILAVGSDVMLINEQGKPLRRRTAPTGWQRIETILKTRNCMCHPSAMIRADALRQIGGYRAKFRNSLDYDLWQRLSEIGKIENIAQDLLLYRRHASQISASGNAHRQTIYSVGAITDHFLRIYLPATGETHIDEANTDDIAQKLIALYQAGTSLDDLHCINRHAIRLLRHSNSLGKEARSALWQETRPNLTVHQRIKAWLYGLSRSSLHIGQRLRERMHIGHSNQQPPNDRHDPMPDQ